MKIKIILLIATLTLLLTSCGRSSPESSGSEGPLSESAGSQVGNESSVSSAPSSTTESSQEISEPEQSISSSKSVSGNVSSTSESTVSQPADSIEQNPFVVGKDEIYDLYLFCPAKVSYSLLASCSHSPREEPDHPVILALNALPLLPEGEKNPGAQALAGFLIIRDDYQKTQINLLECALEVDGAVYTLTAEQYDNLKKLADEAAPKQGEFGLSAQWLVWMNPNRVTKIECTDKTGRVFQIKEHLPLVASEPRYLSLSGGKTYTPGSKDFNAMKDTYRTVMTFDNGVTYTMVFENDNLYLESSDMSFACQYKTWRNNVDSFIKSMKMAEQGIMNPRTGKPVIYLYPEKEQQTSVKLAFKGELTYTYPAYNSGWNVTAYPDGRIVNNADGSEYYYLFWEGISPHKWNFDSGFVVKGKDTEQFLREKLSYMGLTPREYNDFITYWVPQMQDSAYNLLTFTSLAEYAQVAKLQISPSPDSVLRLHMAWKSLDEPVSIPEQQLRPFTRNGFTVVEWGGTEVNEY